MRVLPGLLVRLGLVFRGAIGTLQAAPPTLKRFVVEMPKHTIGFSLPRAIGFPGKKGNGSRGQKHSSMQSRQAS
jgi:hypothetical protein